MNTTVNPCILFLDFDGVTHPEPCYPDNLLCRLSLIEEVLKGHPTVSIVISSSWRDVYSLEQLREFFSSDFALRVIGVTPSMKRPSGDWLPGHVPQYEREWECDSWMRQNRPWGTPWLAIDDRAHWFRPDCSELLLTDSSVGFQLEDQFTLRSILKERL